METSIKKKFCCFRHWILVVALVLSIMAIGYNIFEYNDKVYAAEEAIYKLGDNVTGVLSADGTLTVAGTGDMYDYDNSGENKSPFYQKYNISKLIVGDGVTRIGKRTFEECYNLQEVHISGSVKSIGVDAFIWCSGLRKVVLGEGVEQLEAFAFGRCSKLSEVKLPSTLKRIDAYVFYGCFELKEYELPEGLEYIGYNAFGGCVMIEEFDIPSSVNELAGSIFGACSTLTKYMKYALKNINVSPDNKVYQSIDGVVYSKDGTKIIWYPEGREELYYQVVDGVDTIAEYALNNEYIQQIRLPDTVLYIDDWAFSGCYCLENINLPDGIKSIGADAFQACWKLDNICVPRSVERMGYAAFHNCWTLKNITILNPNMRIQRASINDGEVSDYIFLWCPEDMIVHTFQGSTVDVYMNEFTTDNRAYDLQPVEAKNVSYRTQEEIRQYVSSHSTGINDEVVYEEAFSMEMPYKMGSLSRISEISALNTINIIRYIAGIDNEVSLNSSYSQLAQAASLVNALNGWISHYPVRWPADISDELYEAGQTGAQNSNLAKGYSTLNQAIIKGFMNDGDSSNISKIGHRRWILNPCMSATGFGSIAGEKEKYYAMYATDNNAVSNQYGIMWPAQTMPVEYFGADYPWSVSVGSNVNIDSVKVTLTNMSTGSVWNFQNGNSDGDFYVDNFYYGQKGCIIFRPKDVTYYGNGDKYKVEITGLNTVGMKDSLSYYVDFFSLNPVAFGDANGDGVVNSKDAVLLKKHLAGYKNLNINLEACDVNADGKINSKDAVKLMKKLAGYKVVLGEK